ncbi:hypothetical protein BJ165DRAFT_1403686 [Panaeolus papilionaceus]|nr:hypothetical protein BJ165DRAFT_1403686 [Panaeolus papilionaceus]
MERESAGGHSNPPSKRAREDVDRLDVAEPTSRLAEVENVSFRGTCLVVLDSIKTPKEHIQGLASEVFSQTGYRFTLSFRTLAPLSFDSVHDNRGDNAVWYKSQYWCGQDQERRKKYEISTAPGAKHRSYLGRQRFACKSGMTICY